MVPLPSASKGQTRHVKPRPTRRYVRRLRAQQAPLPQHAQIQNKDTSTTDDNEQTDQLRQSKARMQRLEKDIATIKASNKELHRNLVDAYQSRRTERYKVHKLERDASTTEGQIDRFETENNKLREKLHDLQTHLGKQGEEKQELQRITEAIHAELLQLKTSTLNAEERQRETETALRTYRCALGAAFKLLPDLHGITSLSRILELSAEGVRNRDEGDEMDEDVVIRTVGTHADPFWVEDSDEEMLPATPVEQSGRYTDTGVPTTPPSSGRRQQPLRACRKPFMSR